MVQPAVNSCRLSVERVLEMVSNETNFCSEEYSETLRKALEGVKLYLESFETGRDMAE
jgi:hypothetical protein